jgi:hypothetical protein
MHRDPSLARATTTTSPRAGVINANAALAPGNELERVDRARVEYRADGIAGVSVSAPASLLLANRRSRRELSLCER